MKLMRVPCAAIKPDARGAGYRSDAADELVDSIREKGLLRPILVRESGEGYVIVHGERRWRAVQALGHVTIAAWLVLDLLHRSSGVL